MEAEVQDYLTKLGVLKEEIRNAIQGLDDNAANWRPLPKDTNSIYAILCHLAGSESFWVTHVIGGETVNRDREAEFRASGHLSDVLDRWERIGRASESILSNLSYSQLAESRTVSTIIGVETFTVRHCILHVISHYAIHLGHIQITRQLCEQG
jgi:uncharacterized damage-inducible protein DinB